MSKGNAADFCRRFAIKSVSGPTDMEKTAVDVTVVTDTRLHIVLAEADAAVEAEVRDALLAGLSTAPYLICTGSADALATILTARPCDLVIADLALFRHASVSFPTILKEAGWPASIALAGADAAADARRLLDDGIDDYLLLTELTASALARAVRYAIKHRRLSRDLAEQAGDLQCGDANFRHVIATNADSMVVVDHRGVVRFANEAAVALFQEPAPRLVGHPFPFAVHPGLVREVEIPHAGGRSVMAEMRVVETQWERQPACLASLRDITERKRAEAQLDTVAHYDSLTGLPNRRLFLQLLAQALARASRSERMAALLFLDLDRFKLINDTLGHTLGDLLLKTVADRLSRCLRKTDTIARLGGDEFTVVLEDVQSPDDVARIAHKLLEAVAAPLNLEGHEIFITASIGIALYPSNDVEREGLIRCADTAMYAAKEQRHGFQFFSPEMNAKACERLALETGLRYALQRHELALYYQPLIDFRTGRLVGVEALLRWQHPERGLLAPEVFVPLAEETGLILPIGEWVLRTACTQAKAWQEGGHPDLRVAVNVSRRQCQQPGLVESVRTILCETGLSASSLELELTESLLIQDADRTMVMLDALHQMGVRLSIDDFGAEYSSLGYLKRLPITTLKVDRTFVQDIVSNASDASIATAIITMARALRLNVIAEGVETEGQAAFLSSHHCHEMQGYYFSRPLTADACTTLLADAPAMPHSNGVAQAQLF